MNVASMKMISRINEYVVRCLIPAGPPGSLLSSSSGSTPRQRRRESAPSQCVIELVYGAFMSSGEYCRLRTVPWGGARWFTIPDPLYQRRASAPVLLTEQRGRRTSGIWNARCIDYFVMSDKEFMQFFENSLSPFAPSGNGGRIERLNFYRFVLESYRNTNPYHNKYHAVQVYHVTWHMIQSIQSYYPHCYPLLIAALIHDVDHLGVTNNYLIAVEHPLSILYNDMNILEQHHCAFIFTALSERSDLDIFSRLETAEKRDIRKIIIQLILATDMAKHASLMAALTTDLVPKSKHLYSDEDLLIFGQVILHASDLSNQLTPFPYFVRWAGLCVDEFNRQVEMEKKNNIPVTTFMNCKTDKSMIEMELGFLEFVVLPLWQPLILIEPQLNQWVDTGKQNGKFWRTAIHITEFTRRFPTRDNRSARNKRTARDKQCGGRQIQSLDTYSKLPILNSEENGGQDAHRQSPSTRGWTSDFRSQTDYRQDVVEYNDDTDDDFMDIGIDEIKTDLIELDNPSARLFIHKWHASRKPIFELEKDWRTEPSIFIHSVSSIRGR